MTIMHKAFAGSLSLSFLLLAHAQLPEPKPIPRDGSCPSDYVTEGKFCTPELGPRWQFPSTEHVQETTPFKATTVWPTKTPKLLFLKTKLLVLSATLAKAITVSTKIKLMETF